MTGQSSELTLEFLRVERKFSEDKRKEKRNEGTRIFRELRSKWIKIRKQNGLN